MLLREKRYYITKIKNVFKIISIKIISFNILISKVIISYSLRIVISKKTLILILKYLIIFPKVLIFIIITFRKSLRIVDN